MNYLIKNKEHAEMTIIKHQSLLDCNVQKLCVQKDYFTCGANEEYFKMFDYIKEVSKKENMKMSKIIAIANQKGGIGKTTTAVNLGIGLARHGKKVLLIDADSQGSLSLSLGIQDTDEINNGLANAMQAIIDDDENYDFNSPILSHDEGVDFIPSNIELSGLEIRIISVMGREQIFSLLLQKYTSNYDYIIIDCMSSLGIITFNVLVASDEVIIPTLAQLLSTKGIQALISTIAMVKKRLNPKIEVGGILITMMHSVSTFQKEVKRVVKNTYDDKIKIFDTSIPTSVKVAETTAYGKSIYQYDKKSKVAQAYEKFTEEVILKCDFENSASEAEEKN